MFVARDFHAAKITYQLSFELEKDFPHFGEFLIGTGAEAFLKDKIDEYFLIDSETDELVAKKSGRKCKAADYFSHNRVDYLFIAVSKGSSSCEKEIIECATNQGLPIYILFCDAIRPQFKLKAANQKMLAINEKTLNYLDSEYPNFQKFGLRLASENKPGNTTGPNKKLVAAISEKEKFVIYYFLQSDRIPDHDYIFLTFIEQLQNFDQFYKKFEVHIRAHPAEPQALERLRPHCLKLPFEVHFEIGGGVLDEVLEIADLTVSINSLCLEDYLIYCGEKGSQKSKPLYLLLTADVRGHLESQNGTWKNEYMSNGLAGFATSDQQIFPFLRSSFSGDENLPYKFDVNWSIRHKNARSVSWLAIQLKAHKEV